ncbi:unnamed protein product, partial [Didymodactylos carnosus]
MSATRKVTNIEEDDEYAEIKKAMAKSWRAGKEAEKDGDDERTCISYKKTVKYFDLLKNSNEYQKNKMKWDIQYERFIERIERLSSQPGP